MFSNATADVLVDVLCIFVSPLIDFSLLHCSRSCAVDPCPWSHAHLFNVDVNSHVGNVQPAEKQCQTLRFVINRDLRIAVTAERGPYCTEAINVHSIAGSRQCNKV